VVEQRIALINPVRTAVGRFGGSLKDFSPLDLGALVVRAVVERSGLPPSSIERVVAGENIQLTPRGNPARQVLLRAGIPKESDDYSINMNCASGLRAMTALAQDILLGDVEVGIVVGMEVMSQTPYLLEDMRWGAKFGNRQAVDFLADYILGDAGPMAEKVARAYEISREDQDAWAYRSHRRAIAAIDAGKFEDQIVPVEIPQRRGPAVIFDTDEHPRRDTTPEKLAKLRPAFQEGGTVTAGNASGINDGAAAMLMMTEAHAQALGLKPMAYLKAWVAAGVEPSLFGIGPVPATRKALSRAGLSLEDVGLTELNEAFASSTLAVIRELGMDEETVNVDGGAIGLGHPVGATGLILTIKLLDAMARRDESYGLVTMCVGNGQGMSVIIER
jgi:acetyl-CoA C-acetyltransferase